MALKLNSIPLQLWPASAERNIKNLVLCKIRYRWYKTLLAREKMFIYSDHSRTNPLLQFSYLYSRINMVPTLYSRRAHSVILS